MKDAHEFQDEFRIVGKPSRSALSSLVAIIHMWPLSTWKVASPNWDVLLIKYTPDFEDLVFLKVVKYLNNFHVGNMLIWFSYWRK